MSVPRRHIEAEVMQNHLLSASPLDGDMWPYSLPSRFNPWKIFTVQIEREAGWAPQNF